MLIVIVNRLLECSQISCQSVSLKSCHHRLLLINIFKNFLNVLAVKQTHGLDTKA